MTKQQVFGPLKKYLHQDIRHPQKFGQVYLLL